MANQVITRQVLQRFRQLHTDCDGCIVNRCRRPNCVAILPARNALCLDCDRCHHFAVSEKKPDFIVHYVGEQHPRIVANWIVIEMKSTTSSPTDLIEQLQSEAAALEDMRVAPRNVDERVSGLVLRSGSGRSYPTDVAQIQAARLSCFGQRGRIALQRCGYDLNKVVDALSPSG